MEAEPNGSSALSSGISSLKTALETVMEGMRRVSTINNTLANFQWKKSSASAKTARSSPKTQQQPHKPHHSLPLHTYYYIRNFLLNHLNKSHCVLVEFRVARSVIVEKGISVKKGSRQLGTEHNSGRWGLVPRNTQKNVRKIFSALTRGIITWLVVPACAGVSPI